MIVNDPTITFFPVGNGDTTLVRLSDGTSILVDINARRCDDEEEGIYDVHQHLLDHVKRDERGRPHLDLFILTHPDQDHLRGVERVFFFGDARDYTQKDLDDGKIIVDEIGFAPRIFAKHERELTDDAKLLRTEGQRRLTLHEKGSSAADQPGNRLILLGYTGNPALECIDHLCVGAGQESNRVNRVERHDFSFFVHAPFKAESDGLDADRNSTSVVLQLRFALGGDPRACLVFLAGDTDSDVMERVVKRSEKPVLEWDLLLAPHHCSWKFFAPTIEQPANAVVASFVKERCRLGAYVVSSSKPIKDDDLNPPCYKAALHYRAAVGSDHMLCTGEEPSESAPAPLVFRMTVNGPMRSRATTAGSIRTSAASRAVSTPKTYG